MKTERKQTEIEKIIRDVLENLGYTLANTAADYSMVSVKESEKLDHPDETNIIRLLDFIYNQETKQRRNLILKSLIESSTEFYENQPWTGATISPEEYAENARKERNAKGLSRFWENIFILSTLHLQEISRTLLYTNTPHFSTWQDIYKRNGAGTAIVDLALGQMSEAELSFEEWLNAYASSSSTNKEFAIRQLALEKLAKFIRPFSDWQSIWAGMLTDLTEQRREKNKGLRLLAFHMMIGATGAKTFNDWKYVCDECMNGNVKAIVSSQLKLSGKVEFSPEIVKIKGLALNKMTETATSFHELSTILENSKEYEYTHRDGHFKFVVIDKMVAIAKTFEAWRIIKENAYGKDTQDLASERMMAFLKKPKSPEKAMQTA
jgi:hypothetical protein